VRACSCACMWLDFSGELNGVHWFDVIPMPTCVTITILTAAAVEPMRKPLQTLATEPQGPSATKDMGKTQMGIHLGSDLHRFFFVFWE